MNTKLYQSLNSVLKTVSKFIIGVTVFLLMSNGNIYAQWTQVNNGLTNTAVTSMFTFMDTLMVGTDGGGIFKSTDHGDNWIDISGNIGNKNINDIRGGGGSKVIFAATDNGSFLTVDHANYDDNTSTGLTNTNLSYYWFGAVHNSNTEWAIGSNGGGVFTSANINGPWNDANAGISGNGLFVNDLSGYDDGVQIYAALATEGGVYFSTDTLASWTNKSNGLTGDALLVKRIVNLETLVFAVTRGGLFYTLDSGNNWTALVANEVFNTISILPTGGFEAYVFGTNGFYTADGISWVPVDMTGITGGEVTSSALNSTYIFVGAQTGGVFRKSLVTGIEDDNSSLPTEFDLEQNYPNPFNPSTNIKYSINHAAHVKLEVYNISGQLVATLVNERKPGGNYTVNFNAGGLASGLYFYKLNVGEFGYRLRKMILLK